MILLPGLLFAQTPTDPCPGQDPFDTTPCDLPLDSYVIVLIVVCGVFAALHLRKNNRENLNFK